ncbi:hypothetical protein C8F04DRAFT_1173907 [Mycena alexandri]|uniref:Uncharacterized protein n=1 Tax=Mycena alexandri TaxID=1745969 RepID=A0AAD6TJ88_9AGAR|nr:hypothetical protein C8F04DRAFT_1173907 [Mycena alexandri]
MPLFKSNNNAANNNNAPEPDNTPARKGSMFSRRRSVSPPPAANNRSANNSATSPTRRGFFGGGRASLDSGTDNNNNRNNVADNGSVRSGGSSFFGSRTGTGNGGMGNFNVHKDPTIMAAREKVTHAEQAEIAADRALVQARNMVREARDHVQFLEREAAEEAKRAKAKQAVSNDVSKSAAGLGRHGN